MYTVYKTGVQVLTVSTYGVICRPLCDRVVGFDPKYISQTAAWDRVIITRLV